MAITAASSGSGGDIPMCDMNMTPLIDVLLVLLIMFIVTIPVMTHAVKLDMPQANNQPPPTVLPEVIDLEVDFDGTIVWNGSVVSLGQLENFFNTESAKDPQPEIHLRPDRRARYGVVALVLATAQRNRMKRIGFVNTADFRE